jgi:hypothetical protein
MLPELAATDIERRNLVLKPLNHEKRTITRETWPYGAVPQSAALSQRGLCVTFWMSLPSMVMT